MIKRNTLYNNFVVFIAFNSVDISQAAWIVQSSGTSENLFSLSFFNSDKDVAIGSFNTLNTGITNPFSNTPKTFKLDNIYPNRFNPDIKIGFELPQDNYIKLNKYNLPEKKWGSYSDINKMTLLK